MCEAEVRMSESYVEQVERDKSRVVDRLAIVAGVFGTRGWGEIEVDLNGRRTVLPVSAEVNAIIQYARKVLADFDRKPIPMIRSLT